MIAPIEHLRRRKGLSAPAVSRAVWGLESERYRDKMRNFSDRQKRDIDKRASDLIDFINFFTTKFWTDGGEQ